MAWIQSHQELKRHLKTHRAATALGISVPALVGHLHCLWYDCLDFAQDGNLTYVTNAEVARMAMWEGDADLLVSTLVETGFLDQDGDQLHVHDWQEYGGRVIEKRKNDRERKARSRNQPIERENLSAGSHAEVTRKSQDTGRGIPNLDKNRVEKNVSSSLVGDSLLVTEPALPPAAPAEPDGSGDQIKTTDPDWIALCRILGHGPNSIPEDLKLEARDVLLDLRACAEPKATPEAIAEFATLWRNHPDTPRSHKRLFPGEVMKLWPKIMACSAPALAAEPVEVPETFPKQYRNEVLDIYRQSPSAYREWLQKWNSLDQDGLKRCVSRVMSGEQPWSAVQEARELAGVH